MDRNRLPQSRTEAIAFYRKFLVRAAERSAEHLRQAKRWLGRNDLFFLLTVICHRKDLNHDWLFARCREVEHNPNGYLDLWSRDHYKSTAITFGLSLQDVIASHGDDPEERYGGREVTIGIFSFSRPQAKSFLRQIKFECETNDDLKALYPDILWETPSQSPKWSEDDGIVFRRKTNPKEATVEAWGLVDGMPTGKHFFIRVYDDVVTESSVTEQMIPKTTTAWELSESLGTEGGWARYIGTRYHLFDTYAAMMERGIPARKYPCTSDGSEDFSKAVLKSVEYLTEKRKKQGLYTFACQMLLNPVADKAQGFREEWLRYWPAAHTTGMNLYLIVDPGGSKKRKTNDYTVMSVIGIDGAENYYLVDMVRDRLNLTERARNLFALHRKWRPIGVGYEQYGMQADIEHIQTVMEKENYRFTITELGGALAKADRIKRLVPKFEAGQFYLPERGIVRTNYEGHAVDLVRSFVQEEYLAFPVCAHDDMLDDLARILDPEMMVRAPEPEPDEKPKWMQELEDEYEDAAGGGFMVL